jgi:hypothetical protein
MPMLQRLTFLFALFALLSIGVSGQAVEDERVFNVTDINSRATLLVKPDVQVEALNYGADGTILRIRIAVDTEGNVFFAECDSGCHPQLKDSAERAAMESKFKPLVIDGKAVKFRGLLMYPIAVKRVNWYMFGKALETSHIFDNISLVTVVEFLTAEFADEKASLKAINSKTDFETRNKTIEGVIASIRKKLKNRDIWLFELGIAVRRVIAPLNSATLDRSDIQKALDTLASLCELAPVDIPPQYIENLRTVSIFKINPKQSDKDLRQAISELNMKLQFDLK